MPVLAIAFDNHLLLYESEVDCIWPKADAWGRMKPSLFHLGFDDLFQFGIGLANPFGAAGTRARFLIAIFGASRVTLSADATNEFDATLERLVCTGDGTKLLLKRELEHLAALRTSLRLGWLGDFRAMFLTCAEP